MGDEGPETVRNLAVPDGRAFEKRKTAAEE
jgi:hypothetical protein